MRVQTFNEYVALTLVLYDNLALFRVGLGIWLEV